MSFADVRTTRGDRMVVPVDPEWTVDEFSAAINAAAKKCVPEAHLRPNTPILQKGRVLLRQPAVSLASLGADFKTFFMVISKSQTAINQADVAVVAKDQEKVARLLGIPLHEVIPAHIKAKGNRVHIVELLCGFDADVDPSLP